jgi:hypothetical protein
MLLELAPAQVAYRNFNLCPHCELLGFDPLLLRLCEGIPMISRSDGSSFHLVLADRPLPYPQERNAGPTRDTSLCFWYSITGQKNLIRSSLVLVPASDSKVCRNYREIEFVADLLSEKLLHQSELARMYALSDSTIHEICY